MDNHSSKPANLLAAAHSILFVIASVEADDPMQLPSGWHRMPGFGYFSARY